jgi:leucyl-tRNA synthetase
VLLLAPIVPHICQSLWESLGNDTELLDVSWPVHDESALVSDQVTVVVQINGKLRARMEIATDTDGEAVKVQALADENVKRFLDDKTVRKVIYVPGKLVNIVAN